MKDFEIEHIIGKFILPDETILNYNLYHCSLDEAANYIKAGIANKYDIDLPTIKVWLSDAVIINNNSIEMRI